MTTLCALSIPVRFAKTTNIRDMVLQFQCGLAASVIFRKGNSPLSDLSLCLMAGDNQSTVDHWSVRCVRCLDCSALMAAGQGAASVAVIVVRHTWSLLVLF